MQNVKLSISEATLTIKIDLTAPGVLSKSGKSKVLSSTKGNICLADEHDDSDFADITEGVYLGLNCYRKA